MARGPHEGHGFAEFHGQTLVSDKLKCLKIYTGTPNGPAMVLVEKMVKSLDV